MNLPDIDATIMTDAPPTPLSPERLLMDVLYWGAEARTSIARVGAAMKDDAVSRDDQRRLHDVAEYCLHRLTSALVALGLRRFAGTPGVSQLVRDLELEDAERRLAALRLAEAPAGMEREKEIEEVWI